MNPAALLELAKRWEEDAKPPKVISEDELHADVARRTALLECASNLRSLMQLLWGVR